MKINKGKRKRIDRQVKKLIAKKKRLKKGSRKSVMKSQKWKALTDSVKMDWRTPRKVTQTIITAFGPIGLDPCASHHTRYQFATTNYTGKRGSQSGLDATWRGMGLVYANPEYGRQLIHWIKKAVNEFKKKGSRKDELILLTPARTDTKWFQDELRPHADAVCFWKGRMHFDEHGDPAPFASLLTYFGPRRKLFKDTFSKFGWTLIGD